MTKRKYKVNKTDKRSRAKALGYRSWFEVEIAQDLDAQGHQYKYEPMTMNYTLHGIYKPDFVFTNGQGNQIIVEVKGYLDPGSKRKMKAVKKQNPDSDIRFVFQHNRPNDIKWAVKNGFKYAIGRIDPEWWE